MTFLRYDQLSSYNEPSRTQRTLPARDERPALTFSAIASYGGQLEAVFGGLGRRVYSLTPKDVARALEVEAHERDAGMPYTTLHQFELARNQFGYTQRDRYIRKVVNEVENVAVPGSVMLGIAAVAASAVVTVVNVVDSYLKLDPFSDQTASLSAGKVFQVDRGGRTSAIGNPDMYAVEWDFAGDHRACVVGPRSESERISMSWLSKQYTRDCKPVEAWPAASLQQQDYTAAYLAYLQVAKPEAKYTLEQVQELVDKRRAIMKANPELKVTLP